MTIESAIEEVRGRWRRVRLGESLCLGAALACALVVALAAADNLLHLPVPLRWAGAAAFVGTAGWLLWARVRPAVALRPSDDDVAILIERADASLDNHLINSVQLGRERLTGFRGAIARLIAQDAAARVGGVRLATVVSRAFLRRVAIAAAGAAALVVAYAALFPAYFLNAIERYAKPGAFVAPITATRLAVEPGHATVLEGESVEVRAVASGVIPGRATLTVDDASGRATYEMRFSGDAFVFELKNLRARLAYSVEAGDAQSETFRVDVVEKPRIARMAVECRWPAYLNRPPRVDDPADGNLAVVKGTRVLVTATANKPLRQAKVQFDSRLTLSAGVDGATVRVRFDVEDNDRYRFLLTDLEGFTDREAPAYSITCVPDAPPTVAFREPSRSLSLAADAEFTASIEAKDDFGLAEVSIWLARDKNEQRLEAWPVQDTRETRAAGLVRLKPLGLKPGETISLVAKARDLKGQEATSRPVLVRVISDREERERAEKDLATLKLRLRKVLERQRAAHAEAKKGLGVAAAQREILDLTLGILRDWTDPQLRRLPAHDKVRGLSAKEMPEAVRQTGAPLLATQERIIKVLEEVLDEVDRLIAAIRADGLDKALQDAMPADASAIAKDLLRGLREFVDEQKKVIALSQELKGIAPEDLTDEQKKQLESLKATEEKWGKFFQEKVTDLSKLPPQDMSSGEVLKELIEARSDVELAAEKLGQKNVEMAVPLEESGLELAKALTANIERWLADVPDKLKWNMEEPTTQPEVPMADLPEQLEDLIGDLIDSEEDMTEETEDVTSSWMDSLNEGAGWTAMDGPISNMSAKGITGNLNPNSNEVGGRSGEGRSGKSSGQMVEESAQGKGGRQTPTRATPDPYEKGQVQDTSKDPTGGATGGGKESAANKEGLRGQPPPETRRKMDRLADQQADVRNAAEKIKAALEKRSYHSEDLKKAVDAMRYMEDQLRKGRGGDYSAVQKRIVEQLTVAKKVMGDTIDANRDLGRALPKELRDEVLNALDEELPKDYQDAIKAYYKSLSEKP